MGDLIARYRAKNESDSDLSPDAKRAREFAVKRLERSWPGISNLKPVAVTKEAIKAWSDRTHTAEPQPVQPAARRSPAPADLFCVAVAAFFEGIEFLFCL